LTFSLGLSVSTLTWFCRLRSTMGYGDGDDDNNKKALIVRRYTKCPVAQ